MGQLNTESKEDRASATPANGEDVNMENGSDAGEGTANHHLRFVSCLISPTVRTKSLGHSKEREAARAKQASEKQAQADRRRIEDEVAKLERRLEGIEREFRKLLGAVRVKPLGRDRFYNRIWWFDGMGAASLVGTNGNTQYGTGRIFIQGPSEFDMELLNQRLDEGIEARRVEEEGEQGVLKSNEWAVYNELEEVRLLRL